MNYLGTLAASITAAAAVAGTANASPTPAPDGAALYAARCAACHDHPADRTPPKIMLQTYRTPEEIIAALTNGAMRQQAAGLSADEIHALAVHLTGKEPVHEQADPMANACKRTP